MVIIIISVVTGMAVSSGISVVENSRQSSTLKKMAEIDKAMLAFRITNDRLPCPAGLTILKGATTYGIEASDAGVCRGVGTQDNRYVNNSAASAVAVAEGAVPAVTLGLPADYMYDGWGRRIRYAVDVGMTYANSFTNNPAGAKCGAITLRDTSGGAIRSDGTTLKGSIYALISHGSNGHGGYTNRGVIFNNGSSDADELVNCHCNASAANTAYGANYVQKKNTTTFDDIVTYKERPQMQLATDKPGNVCPYIYVNEWDWVDTQNIKKFDIRGNYLYNFTPAAYSILAVDRSGNLWGNTGGNVQKLDANGNVLSTVNVTSWDPALFGGFMAFDSRNNLWIVSTQGIVKKYDMNGNNIMSIPPEGATNSAINGKFSSPREIAIDSKDNIWVADTTNARVQKFDSAGNWLFSIGWSSTTPDCRTNPYFSTTAGQPACTPGTTNDGQFPNSGFYDLFVDGNDNLWVADQNRLQEFDANGTLINKLTSNLACWWGVQTVGLTPDGVVWSVNSVALQKIVMTGFNAATCTTTSSNISNPVVNMVITGR